MCLTTLQDLLHAKADPNVADNVGRTALSWAVTNKMGMALFAACHTIGHFGQRMSNILCKFSKKKQKLDCIFHVKGTLLCSALL